MKYKKSQNLFWVLYFVSLGFYAAGFITVPTSYKLIVTGIIITFLNLIQAFIYSRCPHCSALLMSMGMYRLGRIGIYVVNPKYCPKCGKELY